ncbi:chemotaxis protein CheD [Salinispira pacifica]
MFSHYDSKLERTVLTLHPGEYLATADDIVIATILGSCVAVALWDRRQGIGGLNHFMLPGRTGGGSPFLSEPGKYGMYAMESLVNEMLKLGARRQDLAAKVFGGGAVLRGNRTAEPNRAIPDSNIGFAVEYLSVERIPIENTDVGGSFGRKIYLFPRTFRVLLKRITGTLITSVEQEEKDYLEKIRKEAPKGGETRLF